MENNMTIDRVYKIAQTGQTAEPSAVDNIMAQYQPKQEQGGFWNGLKNFAGSDVGRMLIGGLGTAAAVGLSGGNGRDALRYGLMGAGNTMNSIDARKRYRDKLMKEQQERADRMAEAEKTRQLQIDLANKRIEANKAAADLAFERKLQEIAANRDFQRELAKENRQYALEDRQSDYDFRTKLANDQHERTLEALGLKNDFAREGWKYQADREDARYERGLRDELAREERAENRYQNRLNDTRDYEARLLEDKIRRENELWERNQQAALDKEERDARRYDARLSDTRDYENQVRADERAYKQDLLDEQRKYDADLLKEQRAYNSGLLANERAYNQEVARQKQLDAIELANIKAQNDAAKQQAKLDYEAQKERQKAELKREEAQRRNTELQPRVVQSIDRAYKALEDGTGLGQFGGWGWTTGKGGQNRADIQNAQAQINTAMRGLLSEMGVGATEMNSAVEANAYRYAITPDMPIEQIRQVLDNFRADYLSGDLQRNLATSVGGSNLSSISTDDLVGML